MVLKVIDRRTTLLSVVDLALLLVVNYITLFLFFESNSKPRNLIGWLLIVMLYSKLLVIAGTHILLYLIDLQRRLRKLCRHQKNKKVMPNRELENKQNNSVQKRSQRKIHLAQNIVQQKGG